jgi:hypothetical protein
MTEVKEEEDLGSNVISLLVIFREEEAALNVSNKRNKVPF